MQALSLEQLGYADAKNKQDLQVFFEYSPHNIEVVEDGLKEVSFGEYLIEQGVLDRCQLFKALQLQDRLPGVRLGEAAAALGFAAIADIEKRFVDFQAIQTVTIE